MTDIAHARLAAQSIARHDFETPAEVVSWLGAVQAQDWPAAKWAVGLRLEESSEAEIQSALDAGAVLRIHAMRCTWQLVAPEDAQWILSLVAPRVLRRLQQRSKEMLSIDARMFVKSTAVIAKALRGGAQLTRAELASVLDGAGVARSRERLSHLLGHAELEGIICSGARRGKQMTWALFDERVNTSKKVSDPLKELGWRYFRSRGPATADDFAWWSGLEAAQVRQAVESNRLVRTTEGDRTLFSVDSHQGSGPRAVLLPAFDELMVGYRDRSDMIDPKHQRRLNAGGGERGRRRAPPQ